MNPVTVSATISRPRQEVFAYLADIANHPEFNDHYTVDWHLTRVESYGAGAGARFRIKAPLARFNWAEVTFAEVQPPYKIVEHGRWGKYNRIRMLGTYTLQPGPEDSTRVEFTLETLPVMPSDKLMEALGGRAWTKHQLARAMRRLQHILEEDRDRGPRATIAGL